MGIDTVVFGGETARPATDRFSDRTSVSFFLDQLIYPSFVSNCSEAYQAPQSTSVQPFEPHRREISQANQSATPSPLPKLGDTTLLCLFPQFPRGPVNLFGRESMLKALLGLAERSASVTLFGAGGMGKTAVVLMLLRHSQIAEMFGKHRYFVHCDVVENSLDGFLEHLSDIMGSPRSTDVAQPWSHLEDSHCILVLDRVDHILDPRAPGAAEIATAIQEFGRCSKACLLATSRMDIKIPDFLPMEVQTLPEEAARNTFHSHCRLGRSAAVDRLLLELDFHPLSVTLLANAVSENNWDEPMLLEAWSDGKTSILKASGHQSLEEMIESILRSPTIQELGTIAQETLEAIATFPGDVKEIHLLSNFPWVDRIGDAINALCKVSLMYRQDGFVKMFSPFRLYFRGSMQTLASRPRSHASYNSAAGDIRHTSRCSSFSVCLLVTG